MSRSRALGALVKKVYVIARGEDISNLLAAFSEDGFEVAVVRGPYTEREETLTGVVRCLVNHRNAWRQIVQTDGLSMVVEADFVPVRGLAKLGAPAPVDTETGGLFGYLYAGGPVLYGVSKEGFPYGHACSTVAYLVDNAAARALVEFGDDEIRRAVPGDLRPWDTYLSIILRETKGVRTYLPYFNYGEHGGVPNPEHIGKTKRPWHQADLLWGRLAFAPEYTRRSRLTSSGARVRAWFRSVARVLMLRYFDPRHIDPKTAVKSWAYLMLIGLARLIGISPRIIGLADAGDALRQPKGIPR